MFFPAAVACRGPAPTGEWWETKGRQGEKRNGMGSFTSSSSSGLPRPFAAWMWPDSHLAAKLGSVCTPNESYHNCSRQEIVPHTGPLHMRCGHCHVRLCTASSGMQHAGCLTHDSGQVTSVQRSGHRWMAVKSTSGDAWLVVKSCPVLSRGDHKSDIRCTKSSYTSAESPAAQQRLPASAATAFVCTVMAQLQNRIRVSGRSAARRTRL